MSANPGTAAPTGPKSQPRARAQRRGQSFLPPFRGLKSTATFIDRSAVTEASIIQILLQATGNKLNNSRFSCS